MTPALAAMPCPAPAGHPMSAQTLRLLLDYLEPASPSFVASLHADGGAIDLHAVLGRYATFVDLIQAAADFSHCDHLGLLLGQACWLPELPTNRRASAGLAEFGGELARVRATLRLGDLGQVVARTSLQTTRLAYVVTDPAIETGGILADCEMVLLKRVLLRFLGPHWTPELVELPRRPPLDCRPYRRMFNCPISFNASAAALHFDALRVDNGLRSDDPHESRFCDPFHAGAEGAPLAARVARQMTLCISMGERASAGRIAHLLGIGNRTLQRQLDQSQTSYRAVSDDVRFGMARRLLRDTDIDLTEIALSLGYSDVSVLTRAFSRWAGTCPSNWRTRHLGAHGRRGMGVGLLGTREAPAEGPDTLHSPAPAAG